ncbi:MAG: hypothetical protein AAFS10_08870, partial [Myxococcota bacterium]
ASPITRDDPAAQPSTQTALPTGGITALSTDVLAQLAPTHPMLTVDASSPEMTIEGAARQVLEQTQAQARRQARRQLLGAASTPSASQSLATSGAIHRTPGLLAAAAEQRAVRTGLSLARMFSPSMAEVSRVAEATLAGTPLDRFLGRPPLGTVDIAPGTRALSATATPGSTLQEGSSPTASQRTAQAPLSVVTARQALSLDTWAARPEAAANAMSFLGAENGPPMAGRTARRTVDFGGTALRALTVAEGTSGVVGNAGAPSMTWMRRGGRGTLLEGMIGGAKAEDKAQVAAATARVQPATTALPSPTAALAATSTASASAFPAAMGNAPRVAASLIAPPTTVTMAQADPGRSAVVQREAFTRAAMARTTAPTQAVQFSTPGQTATLVGGPPSPSSPAQTPRLSAPLGQGLEQTPATTESQAPLTAKTSPASVGNIPTRPAIQMVRAQRAEPVGLYDAVMASGAATPLYDSYDATAPGDFAEMVARATITRPALRRAMALGQMGGIAQLARTANTGPEGTVPSMGLTPPTSGTLVGIDAETGTLPGANVAEAEFGAVTPRAFMPGATRAALQQTGVRTASDGISATVGATLSPGAASPIGTALPTGAEPPAGALSRTGPIAGAGLPALPERMGGAVAPSLQPSFQRQAPVRLQDVLVSPRYLQALTHGIERVEQSLSLLSRLSPMSLRPMLEAGAPNVGVRARQRAAQMVGAPIALPQLSEVANALAAELVAGSAAVNRDWSVGSWIAEDKLDRDWRLAAVADQIAEVIRGHYNVDEHIERERVRAQRAMASWGPSAVYIQLPETQETTTSPAEPPAGSLAARRKQAIRAAAARKAIDTAVQQALAQQQAQQQSQATQAPAPIGVASLRQLVQPTSAPSRAAAALEASNQADLQSMNVRSRQMAQAIEARIRREEQAATRSLRLFSPEKTLAMLAPQLESGGLVNPVDRAELSEALQALASTSRSTSAPQRLRTAFGTLTLQMKEGQLVVDAEELSSNAPAVSMRTTASAPSAMPARQMVRPVETMAAQMAAAAERLTPVASPEAQRATTAALAASPRTTAAAVQPYAGRAAVGATPSAPVQVTLGLPSRAERSAGVQLDPAP